MRALLRVLVLVEYQLIRLEPHYIALFCSKRSDSDSPFSGSITIKGTAIFPLVATPISYTRTFEGWRSNANVGRVFNMRVSSSGDAGTRSLTTTFRPHSTWVASKKRAICTRYF